MAGLIGTQETKAQEADMMTEETMTVAGILQEEGADSIDPDLLVTEEWVVALEVLVEADPDQAQVEEDMIEDLLENTKAEHMMIDVDTVEEAAVKTTTMVSPCESTAALEFQKILVDHSIKKVASVEGQMMEIVTTIEVNLAEWVAMETTCPLDMVDLTEIEIAMIEEDLEEWTTEDQAEVTSLETCKGVQEMASEVEVETGLSEVGFKIEDEAVVEFAISVVNQAILPETALKEVLTVVHQAEVEDMVIEEEEAEILIKEEMIEMTEMIDRAENLEIKMNQFTPSGVEEQEEALTVMVPTSAVEEVLQEAQEVEVEVEDTEATDSGIPVFKN